MVLLGSHAADEGEEDALDTDARSLEDERVVRGIAGLEADAGPVPVEALERGLGIVDERDDDLAFGGRRLAADDHEIAVPDVIVDHRVAADAEREDVRVVGED